MVKNTQKWMHPDTSIHFEAFINHRIDRMITRKHFDFEDDSSNSDEISNEKEDLKQIFLKHLPASFIIPNYDLPIKGGGVLRCSVLNPYILLNKSSRLEMYKNYSKTMSGGIDILIKKQNTERFFEFAESACKDYDNS